MRAVLSPAFTGSKMRLMFQLVKNCIRNGIETFDKDAIEKEQEMKAFFSKFTIDIIATSAFGLEVNSFENPRNEMQMIALKALNRGGWKTILKFIGFSLFPGLMKLLNIKVMDPEVGDFFRSTIIDAFEHRKKNNIVRHDMINLLMEVTSGKLTDGENILRSEEKIIRKWSDDEIIAQCMTFYLAGFKTTSTALSMAAYELALNVDVQEKLRAEILKARGKTIPKNQFKALFSKLC